MIPHRALTFFTGHRLQITVLLSLIAVNGAFDVPLYHLLLIFAAGVVTQHVGCALARIPVRYLSGLITCCSLSLLLRTDTPLYAALAAVLAVGSKFLFRAGGKHVFNPANLALTVLLLSDVAWVSPGQWGAFAFASVAVAFAGLTINSKVGRYDMSLLFLTGWAAALFWRAHQFGDPVTIPLHALQSVGVPLFSFFMLPDPATTPSSRPMRLVFAACVLVMGLYMQWKMFLPEGFIYALTAVSAVRGAWLLCTERGFFGEPPSRPSALSA